MTALHRCALLVQKLTKCFHHLFPKHLLINYPIALLDPGVVCLYLSHRKGYMTGNSRQKLSTELITKEKKMSLVGSVAIYIIFLIELLIWGLNILKTIEHMLIDL